MHGERNLRAAARCDPRRERDQPREPRAEPRRDFSGVLQGGASPQSPSQVIVTTLLALRLGRWGIIGFGLVAFANALLQAAGFYQVAGHTDAQRRAFGRSMSILAEQFTVILAPPMSPETVGGYVQWRAFGFLSLLFAIWGLCSASGAARADAERSLAPARSC